MPEVSIPRLRRLPGVVLLVLAFPGPGAAQTGLDRYQRVPRSDLERAIATEAAKGYDLTASTNATRLWAQTLFQLADWAQERTPDGPPLFIHEADYYEGYLVVTGLSESEAPEFIRMSHEYGQHTLLEFRRNRVIDTTETSARPDRALAVRTWWPEGRDIEDSYEFEDTLSNPKLLVVNEQEIRYWLLDFGDQYMFDKIEGIRGRPTSGVLGVLFNLLGTGKILWSRMAISDDGWQVVRASAKKLISKTATVAIQPDGTGVDVPDDRADLQAIAETLERELEVAYRDWPF